MADIRKRIEGFFDTCALTQGLSGDQKQVLVGAVKVLPMAAKKVVFWEGTREAKMYFVLSGLVVVSKKIRGSVEEVIARFRPGDFFGEISLLDSQPRSATVQTDQDSVLLVLEGSKLIQWEKDSPQIASGLYKGLLIEMVKRLRRTNEKLLATVLWGMEATSLGEKEISE